VLPVQFSVSSGELTPTLKLKRKVVSEKFAREIDELFAGSDESPVQTPLGGARPTLQVEHGVLRTLRAPVGLVLVSKARDQK
jgi:hypothetical protein